MKHEVYRLPNGVLVVDGQSDLLNPTTTRVVLPLIASIDLRGAEPGRLTPSFEVEGQNVMLLPLQSAAIPLRELGHQPLRVLTVDEGYAVSGAVGVLFEGVQQDPSLVKPSSGSGAEPLPRRSVRRSRLAPPARRPTMGGGMGVRNYLIEGVSGAGKTAVAAELQRRGHQAIHGDRELTCRGDPQTGAPVAPPTDPPTARWMSEHQVWDVDRVMAYVANRDEPLTFFCGGSRNFATFVNLFDGVFVLEVDLPTMNLRIDQRVARDPGDFGGRPEERALIADLFATKADIPKGGIRIDATAPLDRVVDEILSRCAEAG